MSDRTGGSRLAIARAVTAAGLLLIALAAPVRGASGPVVVLTATGVVDNVMASYISDGISAAQSSGASAVVIELDTPGGSMQSMLDITHAELAATVPVIVWVAPAGAWAASAGTFITLAAHLAYMAPGTSIGAASPVDSNGQDITGTEGDKVRSIAISTITSIAQERGRNVDWAVSTVSTAASASAAEAAAKGAVNGVAATLDAVLADAQGKTVNTPAGPVTVDVAGKPITDASMNPIEEFLHLLSDPNIAFLLFVIGLGGILLEFVHPTVIGGLLGAFCLILAFIGFGSLPLNLAGLILIGFGMLLFVLETQIVSHGLLAIGGIVAFVLGASILYNPPAGTPLAPAVSVAPPVMLIVGIAFALFMGGISIAAYRTRHMAAPRGTVGTAVPLGTVGVVQAPLAPQGTVHLGGETWSARSADGRDLDRDTPVRLVGFDRLVAIVAPDPTTAPATGALPQAGLMPLAASPVPPTAPQRPVGPASQPPSASPTAQNPAAPPPAANP
jgi:membrane-bound serine protease (ClpP class)